MVLGPDEAPLSVVAARNAWWSLDLASLKEVAGHLQLPVPAQSSLFDALVIMVRGVLQNTEEEALAILAQRLVSLDGGQECVQELLEVDEAAKVLTFEDEKVLKKEQEAGKERQNNYHIFAAEYVAKKKAVRAAAQGVAPKASAKGKAKAAAKPAPRRLPARMGTNMSQQEAKEWMPPGSYIWKSNNDGSWCAKLPPFNKVGRSWRRHGEEQALRLVVSLLWHQFMDLHGMGPEDCPIHDLIPFASC
jgi:hypothetical protein